MHVAIFVKKTKIERRAEVYEIGGERIISRQAHSVELIPENCVSDSGITTANFEKGSTPTTVTPTHLESVQKLEVEMIRFQKNAFITHARPRKIWKRVNSSD